MDGALVEAGVGAAGALVAAAMAMALVAIGALVSSARDV